MNLTKYTIPTKTVDTSEKLTSVANALLFELKNKKDVSKAVFIVRKWVNDHAFDKTHTPPKPYYVAKSLIESRSTPASTLVNKPFASCGSQSTLAAALLRHMGYAVKLVHGSYPNTDQHAWIAIYDKSDTKWHEYDMTGLGQGRLGELTKNHHKIVECVDWYDIRELLNQEHIKNSQKRKKT